jgi:hypothetical protein
MLGHETPAAALNGLTPTHPTVCIAPDQNLRRSAGNARTRA